MGFWHTGYMEFHEPTSERAGSLLAYAPAPPSFACDQCGEIFGSRDDLNVHRFDGHVFERPRLLLHGRECGRSRISVISQTQPSDWRFENTTSIRINGVEVDDRDARRMLCSVGGVVNVTLRGGHTDQEFEFRFDIAEERDLAGVDGALVNFIESGELTLHSIEQFIAASDRFHTARTYRDSLVNYFYGVLARERSPESSLWQAGGGSVVYRARFDDAVAGLAPLERPPAEAVCGLVAFHYNQFDLALRKTRSPRVARVAFRLATLLRGDASGLEPLVTGDLDDTSVDIALSDAETERLIRWCSIPLDGSAESEITDVESVLPNLEPADQLKLHVIAAEHHLASGHSGAGLQHADELRHSRVTDVWQWWYRQRCSEEER